MAEVWGTIKRIGIRASVIRTFDGAEVIVPNGMLISDKVTNWTLSDARRRIELEVGVAYGSPAQRVIDLLVGVAKANPRVIANPEPQAYFVNFGGDPVPWLRYPDPAITVLSFLNAEKYPPSPLYLLMTLGAVLMLLSVFAGLDEFRIARVLRTLGRAPLFFYILHLYVLRVAGLTAAALVWGLDQLGPPPLHSTPEWPLPVVWAIWLVAMAILYWPTRWFALLKARRRGGWTSYL